MHIFLLRRRSTASGNAIEFTFHISLHHIRIHLEDRCTADSVDPDMPEMMQRLSLISTSLPNFNSLLKPYPEFSDIKNDLRFTKPVYLKPEDNTFWVQGGS